MKMWKWAVLAMTGVMPATALGDIVTYTVDPTRSSLTISGTYAGNPLQAQSGTQNSLLTSYVGDILVSMDQSANTLEITQGTVTALTNGTLSPISSGHDDNEPGVYGFTSASGVTIPPSNTFTGVLTHFAISLSSGAVSDLGVIDLSNISASVVASSEIDYAFTGPSAVVAFLPISGAIALGTGSGSLSRIDGVDTLTIPVAADYAASLSGQPILLHFSGTIVAVTPEPGSLAFMIGCTLSLVFRRRRAS